jgi:hypothetical protein
MKTIYNFKVNYLRLLIMLIFFSLVIFANKVNAQSSCVNANFSMGDFTDWTGSSGENLSMGVYTNIVNGFNIGTTNSNPSNAGQQTIMNAPATDANTGGLLSVLPPGGTSSCRLGNDNCNYKSERLDYTITVTPSNCIFTYQYAVVLEDPGHPAGEQPKFNIYVLNSSGIQVGGSCGVYEVSAQSGLPGFQNATDVTGGSGTVTDWRDWTTVGIDLSPFIGQQITIQFTAYDCDQGGHYGYAYISCACGNMQIAQQCSGVSDTLTAPAGFPSYSWSPGGATTQSIILNNPANGVTYTCICTAVTGCQLALQTTTNCMPPHLSQQCLGDTVIVFAPVGYSSYSWNTGATTSSIIVVNPVAGDSVSCICTLAGNIDTLHAAVSTIPVTGLTANSVTICQGDTATLTASGLYTYFWNTGQSTLSIAVAPNHTTTYTVTATSSGGCTSSANSVVTVNPAPSGNITSTSTGCGVGTGTLIINPTIGTSPFSYIWSTTPPQTAQTATGLTAGNYTVTITDSNGCKSAMQGVVVNSQFVLSISASASHCSNADGTATVNVTSGGTAPYTYLWNTNPLQTTQTINGIAAGTYTVTVTDSTGCTAISSTTVHDLAGPTAQIANIVNASCGQNDGSITLSVTGGTSPYSFMWSNGAISQSLTNVPGGLYCVTVTDVNNCSTNTCVTILNISPSAPDICLVTADTATNYNLVIWEKPITTGIDKYIIYRETSVAGVYNIIGTQNYSNFSTFIDSTSNSLQQSYRYMLAINDICGDTSQRSSYHQTVHLAINAGINGQWNLIWNNYIGFTFSTYNIYRGTNAANLALLTSISSNNTSYTDLTPPPGTIYYLIEVVKATACNPSKSTNSISSTISNIANTQGSGISEFDANNSIQIMPNPGNGIFTISLQQFPAKDLKIEIYNSLGQIIDKDILNTKTKVIDISGFPKGIYFLKVSSGEKYLFRKIILE